MSKYLLPPDWCCNGSFKRPAALHSLKDGICGHSEVFRPLNYAHRLSVKCFYAVVALISGLLFACGPSAVFRAVRAIIVDSVNGMVFGRPISHVGVKRLKGVEPAVADFNTPASIPVVGGVVGVGASSDYVDPYVMNGLSTHSMPQVNLSSLLSVKASAGNAPFLNEVSSKFESPLTACAFAKPNNLMIPCSTNRNNYREPAKTHPAQVFGVTANLYRRIMKISHNATSYSKVVRGLVVRATSTPHSTINTPALEVFA